jgi:hypothetical protein
MNDERPDTYVLTIHEVADRLKVSDATVSRMVGRAPSCLERFLLVLAYEVKPQRSTVAEAYPRIRHGGRVHP